MDYTQDKWWTKADQQIIKVKLLWEYVVKSKIYLVISSYAVFLYSFLNVLYLCNSKNIYISVKPIKYDLIDRCVVVFLFRAEKLVNQPNTLDLHGLHVDEALHVLTQSLEKREYGRSNTPLSTRAATIRRYSGVSRYGGHDTIHIVYSCVLQYTRYAIRWKLFY